MMNKFVRNYWNQLSAKQQAIFAVIQGSVIGGIIGIAINIHIELSPKYDILFSNLPNDDIPIITQLLEDHHIPYKVDRSNRAIQIPAEQILEQRMMLATENLPSNSVEIEEVIYTKYSAITTELEKVISSLTGIENARVLIDIPENPPQGIPQDGKASVILRLREGYHPSKAELDGIVHLVSSSVEYLTPENVTVVDSQGNELRLSKTQTQD